MKNISELKSELTELLGRNRGDMLPGEKSRIKGRVEFLKTCIMYLETKPKEDFIKTEAVRLEEKICKIMQFAGAWATDKIFESEEKRLNAYASEMNVPKLRTQLKTLNFLLA